MLDHTSTSHSHEVPSSCCRAVASGAVACAINNPAATAYHHQRNPFTASFNSATNSRANALLRPPAASALSRAGAIFAEPNRAETPPGALAIFTTAAPFSSAAPFANAPPPAACTAFRPARPNNLAESNRSNTAAAPRKPQQDLRRRPRYAFPTKRLHHLHRLVRDRESKSSLVTGNMSPRPLFHAAGHRHVPERIQPLDPRDRRE